mgnify:CR=1 FL=1
MLFHYILEMSLVHLEQFEILLNQKELCLILSDIKSILHTQ